MSNTDIYAILASKPHNPHHLKRYWKFIQSCSNSGLEYTEKHHICPKAKDLFPEFKDLNNNPWNCVVLTARQHIMAHVILWKVFGGSQVVALNMMILKNKKRSRKCVPTSIVIRYSARIREEVAMEQKGTSTYIDRFGNKLKKVSTQHEKVLSGEYTHINTGIPQSDEARARRKGFSAFKDKAGGRGYYLSNQDPRVLSGQFIGVTSGVPQSDGANKKRSNRANYKDLNGVHVGMLYTNDPRVLSGEYVHITVGTNVYKDLNGLSLGRLSVSDPKVLSGEAVGFMKKL